VRRMTPLAVLALSLCCVSSAASSDQRGPAADTTVSFSRLKRGDTLWVKYESFGCMGQHERAEIRILGYKPSRTRIIQWPGGVLASRLGRDTTIVSLSRADLEGLDQLVAYYRSGPLGGCTTVERVQLSLSRRGRKGPSLSFADGSCEAHGQPGVVTLGEVLRRGPIAEVRP